MSFVPTHKIDNTLESWDASLYDVIFNLLAYLIALHNVELSKMIKHCAVSEATVAKITMYYKYPGPNHNDITTVLQ
jgi:hypothetical protein